MTIFASIDNWPALVRPLCALGCSWAAWRTLTVIAAVCLAWVSTGRLAYSDETAATLDVITTSAIEDLDSTQVNADAEYRAFLLYPESVNRQSSSVIQVAQQAPPPPPASATPVGPPPVAGQEEEIAAPAGDEPLQPPSVGSVDPTWTVEGELARLNQRMREFETGRLAHEQATRTIILQSLDSRGSNINDHVIFGGTLEALTFWSDNFDGVSESDIILDTAEIDFEIRVNDWSAGSLVFEYDDGQNFIFPTTEGDEVFVDRVNVRQAWITIGNPDKHPLFATLGRDVVPFGISTGDPVADVLTIIDPLTVDVFEMREDFILLGFDGPTCCPPLMPALPATAASGAAAPLGLAPVGAAAVGPPPVRPVFFNPLARRAATALIPYCPCAPPPKPGPYVPPPLTCVRPYSAAVYIFNGTTFDGGGDHIEHIGGTVGYRNRGWFADTCIPWTVDIDVDATSSVFDSRFLEFEDRTFLDQIAYVPGMAAHLKSSFGPTALVLEWNGAVNEATFVDDVGTPIAIQPQAWQIQWSYQFDWNPSVEVIGAQGTYLVAGYSESDDLAGVTRIIGLVPTRVGFVPEKRLSLGIGEWILPGVRVAVEYSHAIDYSIAEGGTGNTADGVFTQVTMEW